MDKLGNHDDNEIFSVKKGPTVVHIVAFHCNFGRVNGIDFPFSTLHKTPSLYVNVSLTQAPCRCYET